MSGDLILSHPDRLELSLAQQRKLAERQLVEDLATIDLSALPDGETKSMLVYMQARARKYCVRPKP